MLVERVARWCAFGLVDRRNRPCTWQGGGTAKEDIGCLVGGQAAGRVIFATSPVTYQLPGSYVTPAKLCATVVSSGPVGSENLMPTLL